MRSTAEISKKRRPRRSAARADARRAAPGSEAASTSRRRAPAGRAATSGGERGELVLDRRDVLSGVALRRGVDEMAEHAAALDVLQETDAEARALVRALDQARDVGDDERAALVAASTTPRCGTSVVNG